jgi:ribosomal protein S18 acetylase RimI-like enzyme
VNSNASIRPIRAAEWPRVREIRLRALEDSPNSFGSTLAREQSFSDRVWAERAEQWATGLPATALVAETGSGWVGIVMSRLKQEDATRAGLYGLWVDPAWRAGGVGRALTHAVIDWARASGARALTLDVVTSNAAAIQLYRRAGFRETGQRLAMPRNPSLIEIEMELDLTKSADGPVLP